MRLLADKNFPLPAVAALRQAGHDVTWARTDAHGTGDLAHWISLRLRAGFC
jgi:hypothetical protein